MKHQAINDDYSYYQNYRLDQPYQTYNMSQKEKQLMEIGVDIFENKKSVREVSRDFMIPKTTIERYIHTRLRYISYELYKLVCKQLVVNKQCTSNVAKRMSTRI